MHTNILEGWEIEVMDPTIRFSGLAQEANLSGIMRDGGGNNTRPGQRFWDLGPRNFRVVIDVVARKLWQPTEAWKHFAEFVDPTPGAIQDVVLTCVDITFEQLPDEHPFMAIYKEIADRAGNTVAGVVMVAVIHEINKLTASRSVA